MSNRRRSIRLLMSPLKRSCDLMDDFQSLVLSLCGMHGARPQTQAKALELSRLQLINVLFDPRQLSVVLLLIAAALTGDISLDINRFCDSFEALFSIQRDIQSVLLNLEADSKEKQDLDNLLSVINANLKLSVDFAKALKGGKGRDAKETLNEFLKNEPHFFHQFRIDYHALTHPAKKVDPNDLFTPDAVLRAIGAFLLKFIHNLSGKQQLIDEWHERTMQVLANILKSETLRVNPTECRWNRWLLNKTLIKGVGAVCWFITCHANKMYPDIVRVIDAFECPVVDFCVLIEYVLRADSGLPSGAMGIMRAIEQEMFSEVVWQPKRCLDLTPTRTTGLSPSVSALLDLSGHPQELGREGQFFRRLFRYLAGRTFILCRNLSVEAAIRDKAWNLLVAALLKESLEMTVGLNIDSVVLCCIYAICKVSTAQMSFRRIISEYQKVPRSREKVFKAVPCGDHTVDIVGYYNLVFLKNMRSEILSLTEDAKGTRLIHQMPTRAGKVQTAIARNVTLSALTKFDRRRNGARMVLGGHLFERQIRYECGS